MELLNHKFYSDGKLNPYLLTGKQIVAIVVG